MGVRASRALEVAVPSRKLALLLEWKGREKQGRAQFWNWVRETSLVVVIGSVDVWPDFSEPRLANIMPAVHISEDFVRTNQESVKCLRGGAQ